MNFKNITTVILLFGLTFFFADYSFAKTHHKKTAVHKVKGHKKSKKNSASTGFRSKKKSAKFGKSTSKKSAQHSKKHKRATASSNEDNWAHTGVPKNRKVGSKYNN
jgi:hypothetical protein